MATHWRSALALDAHARRARSHSSREALENGHMRVSDVASRGADCPTPRHSSTRTRRDDDDDDDDVDRDRDRDDDNRAMPRRVVATPRGQDEARTRRGSTETDDARVDVVG